MDTPLRFLARVAFLIAAITLAWPAVVFVVRVIAFCLRGGSFATLGAP